MREKPYNLGQREESPSAQCVCYGVPWKLERTGWASTDGSTGGIIKWQIGCP